MCVCVCVCVNMCVCANVDRPCAEVLVVGATGYIGKYVTRELCSQGYDVTAFVREKSGIGGDPTPYKPRIQLTHSLKPAWLWF